MSLLCIRFKATEVINIFETQREGEVGVLVLQDNAPVEVDEDNQLSVRIGTPSSP